MDPTCQLYSAHLFQSQSQHSKCSCDLVFWFPPMRLAKAHHIVSRIISAVHPLVNLTALIQSLSRNRNFQFVDTLLPPMRSITVHFSVPMRWIAFRVLPIAINHNRNLHLHVPMPCSFSDAMIYYSHMEICMYRLSYIYVCRCAFLFSLALV